MKIYTFRDHVSRGSIRTIGADDNRFPVNQLLKGSVLIAALLYGIGMFTVRAYLGVHVADDIVDFVNLEYILTGLLYLLLVSLPPLTIGLPFFVVNRLMLAFCAARIYLAVCLLFVSFFSATYILMLVIAEGTFPPISELSGRYGNGMRHLLYHWRIYYPLPHVWMITFSNIILYISILGAYLKRYHPARWLFLFLAGSACFGTLLCFALLQYPFLLPACGGGGRAKSELVLKDETITALSTAHQKPSLAGNVVKDILVLNETRDFIYFVSASDFTFIPTRRDIDEGTYQRRTVYRIRQKDVVAKLNSLLWISYPVGPGITGAGTSK